MRTTILSSRLLVLAVVTTLILVSSSDAAQIEAIHGKHYALTKRHGPWMIMVASFSEPPADRKAKDGLTPDQAATFDRTVAKALTEEPS